MHQLKLYQYSYHPVPFDQQLSDLKAIDFLPGRFDTMKINKVFAVFINKLFPEQHSTSALLETMDRLLVNEHTTLKALYETEHFTLLTTDFYNLALQLLGFEIDVDFKLAQGGEFLSNLGLPLLKTPELLTTKAQLVTAFYYLLCLRTKNGQNYLDVLANRGFFNQFFKSRTPQFVLFNGRLQATFDANTTIREIVYVQSDLDTDEDGQYDLLETTIFRPKATAYNLKVPALYTANPYFKGTNDMTAALHDVNINLAVKPATEPTITSALPPVLQIDQPVTLKTPAVKSETETAEITSTEDNIYSLNDYFLARGLATVYAGGIGTRHSDGIRTSGSPAETLSTTAIIEWLHGDRLAFTNKTDHIAIKAWWCNGNVAMTGKSYLGTMATAAATTGVPGLKAIISESAISSWYDYYRDHGLVVAPEDCQGEDCDVLAIDTFSRLKDAADYQRIKPVFDKTLLALTKGQDRNSGNYNDFWAIRNYRTNVKNIKCAVLLVHGLNDWNVKLRNPEKLWRTLREADIPAKMFLHQGQHVYMNNIRSIDFNDMVNLWLTDKLLGFPNHSDTILPKVLIQDNAQPETWHHYQDWCADSDPKRQYYLVGNELTTQPKNSSIQTYVDDGAATFLKGDRDEHAWTRAIMADHSTYATNRLQYKSQPLDHELYIDGNPILTVQIASSTDHGLLSAMLVDYGQAKRLLANPSIIERTGLKLGYNWQSEDLKEFQLTPKTSAYKLITKGHINLQNRASLRFNQTVTPDHFYTVHFELQPTHYHLLKNHQIGLILYSTDMGMTLRSSEVIHYQIDLADCRLEIPYRR
ncbi:xaa-Pro dipeptidyl-peptidase [Agrilactobacillus composti DSM 18527 = JCM 14202]|uniref:Xaa-Pro dipeptidyl-peptidase n=2 Tax=Agrilactobacillus TaxID=2767875 RepID=A0A0R1Y8E3_9LACO|nr:Xaa-Pro dipeptidyl-peptidase [Agrilactobacillus composti]KRM35830.1 xaa-Pro dipeptidyl-peptidase [Agrilactobacillus composti DSM 18527 = JCM 14202]